MKDHNVCARLAELTNAIEADLDAVLIEISENRDRALNPDERQKYQVTLPATGELLIERAHDPEHQAARILHDRGMAGRMITCWSASRIIAMRFSSIKFAASRATSEGKKSGPKFAKWTPRTDFPD